MRLMRTVVSFANGRPSHLPDNKKIKFLGRVYDEYNEENTFQEMDNGDGVRFLANGSVTAKCSCRRYGCRHDFSRYYHLD